MRYILYTSIGVAIGALVGNLIYNRLDKAFRNRFPNWF